MIIGWLLYGQNKLPVDVIRIILEFYGIYIMSDQIKRITLNMLNNKSLIHFYLLKKNRIKIPTNIPDISTNVPDISTNVPDISTDVILSNLLPKLSNYFLYYNNKKFIFSTPPINLFSKYPFCNPYSFNTNNFNFVIGINTLGNKIPKNYYTLVDEKNKDVLQFMTKFEDIIFTQICKIFKFNKIYKYKSCLIPKEIDIRDHNFNITQTIYLYSIPLIVDDNSKFEYYRENKIIKTKKQLYATHMRKKVKLVLIPKLFIDETKKTICIKFYLKSILAL